MATVPMRSGAALASHHEHRLPLRACAPADKPCHAGRPHMLTQTFTRSPQQISSKRPGRSGGLLSTCRAGLDTRQAEAEVFQGQFGEWSIDDSDRQEVALYRGGLTVAAVALCLATAIGLISPPAGGFVGRIEDVLAFGGAAGLGMSLWYIHIYVAPIKKFIQGLWAVGVTSALILAAKQDAPVVQQVVTNPVTVWGVGPFFAAITGLAFKEGMCYGKAEAGGLFFITPLLLLGHLSGWVPADGQRALLVAFTALFAVFAARKYTQPIKDDLGDKSVFEFLKLPEAEQEARVAELRASRGD